MTAWRALPSTAIAARATRTLLQRNSSAAALARSNGARVRTAFSVATSSQHNGNQRSSSNTHRLSSLANGAAALALCTATLAVSQLNNDTHCEALQRLDVRTRRQSSPTATNSYSKDDASITTREHKAALLPSPLPSPLRQQQQQQSAFFDADYEATHLVGAGSFGMVLQCICRRDGRVAAVKMVQDTGADARDEITRETQALARIEQRGGHAHIVRYDGAYSHNGFHYIVTEFVDGASLFAFLQATAQRRERIDVRTALQLVAQLADALAFLQAQGIVHRDLKPENIMVVKEEGERLTLKLIDFGSAAVAPVDAATREDNNNRWDDAPALSGTRCYWSPEALLRNELTPAMDVWALGCVLFILLTGRHPFDITGTATEQQIVDRIIAREPLALSAQQSNVWVTIPPDVQDLVCGLLAKDPLERLDVDAVRSHVRVRAACASL